MAARSPNSRLADLIVHGSIGPAYCAGHEILRRIFITVRDRNWQEIAPTQWDSQIDEARRTVRLSARHASELVDFEWKGSLQVGADMRSLRFEFQGKPLRDMEVCRLGLIVLHPVEPLVGAKLTAKGPQGEEQLTVCARLHPQPIVNGVPGAMTEPFSQLTIGREDVGKLELCFSGELFELEDQRNWGDASFKTYCTPLRLGFPRAVKAGTSIAHSVEINFTPAAARTAPPSSELVQVTSRSSRNREHDARSAAAVEDRLATRFGSFPTIGRELRNASIPDASGKDEPDWHHIHVDATGSEGATALRALSASSSPVKIEIAVEAEDGQKPPADLLASLCNHRARISRLLIYGPGTSLPTAAAIERWRQALGTSAGPQIPVLAATRGYYVEFNRAVVFDAPVSGIAFPLTATVHADDAATIADNVATIRDMAETARHLTRLSEFVVAPLALYYPASAKPQNFPRQLVAPWLAATLIHAGVGRIVSITLAADAVHAITSPGVEPAAPFLTRLIECAGYEVLPLDGILSPRLHAVALKQPGQESIRILAANLATEPAVLSLADAAPRAVQANDALTGAALRVSGVGIEVPALGVAWIESAK